jgi:DNA mismatch repair protein MutS2
LDVARERGLPAEILRRAEEYLLLDGKDSSQLMGRLNELAVAREKELEELQRRKQDLEQEHKRVQAKLEEKTGKLLEEIRNHSREVVAQWKAGKRQRKQALRELAEDKNRLREELEAKGNGQSARASDRALQVGDRVLYRSWNRSGVIREMETKKKRIKLDLGGVTLWVSASEVDYQPQKSPEMQHKPNPAPNRSQTGASGRVDLRGMRAEEAVASLQQSLDQAVLDGDNELEIIHGRGTGALRRAVHEELARIPEVREYFLANEEQGGDGMTIVRLRGNAS